MRLGEMRADDTARLLDRLADKVLIGDGCWVWLAARSRGGYGQIRAEGRLQYAHRVVYEILVGPIAEGMHLDHRCHNEDPTCPGGSACLHRQCVRPDHLEPVTNAGNSMRMRTLGGNTRATHCVRDHLFDAANTRIKHGPYGPVRQCRTCHRERMQKKRAQR